jgi:hypothetical protein
MTVKMILQDGPLDGEEQVVLGLNTTPGYNMQFNVPNFQTFHTDGTTVVAQGLVAVYTFLGPGRPPNPDPPDFDTWTESWIYEFTGEMTVPVPPPITPPTEPPQLSPAVFMGANTTLVVNANDASPGVFLVGNAGMVINAVTIPVNYASIALIAETYLIAAGSNYHAQAVTMAAQSGMTVTPN